MTAVNLAIVDLLLDCDNFTPETFVARELRHADGRPFSEEEHRLVGEATRAELVAVRDFHAKAAEAAVDQAETLRLLAELVGPYMARFGPNTTVGDVRALMPVEQRAVLDELVARASDAAH